MNENMDQEESVCPNTSSISAPAQVDYTGTGRAQDIREEDLRAEERLEQVLIEGIETVTRLTALITELQVECVRREEELAKMFNPSILMEAREILDAPDPFDRIQELLFNNFEAEQNDQE